jgi:RNA polymerase sigma-70 factor (ECF subfamily)
MNQAGFIEAILAEDNSLRSSYFDRIGHTGERASLALPDFEHDLRVSPTEQPSESSGQHARVFATTHWSVIVRARDSQSPQAASAMERLCHTYWYPLYVFVRRKGYGHEDASDMTQAFFAKFLEKHYLKSVDANLGKFRTFLLTSMTHFLANEWDKSQAQKRGGGQRVISFDDASAEDRYRLEPVEHATPETLFERRWAQTVVGVVLDRLAAETEEKRFELLKSFLLEDKGAVSYDEAAAQSGMSVAAITSAIHRLRARFSALLVEEVSNTVNTPDAVEPELRHLLAALSD